MLYLHSADKDPSTTVRPALTRSFWVKDNTTSSGTWGSSKGFSRPKSVPINSRSKNDAFELGRGKRAGGGADLEANDYCVTILSTRAGGNDDDGSSTERIIDRGITVNTYVDVSSVAVERSAHRVSHVVEPTPRR